MSTHLVIVNPTAGRGAAERKVPYVTQALKTQGLSFDLVRTTQPKHAIELARQAVADGYRTIVTMGGDGTFNEVLNGLMQAQEAGTDVTLGVLCVGTGNDFAYGIGIPLDLEAGCAALARGQTRTIDIGHIVGLRYFGNGIGIGFDAVANVQATRIPYLHGFPLYLVAVLRTLLFYYSAPHTRIEGDDWTIEQPTLMTSILNGRRMGGGFLIAPQGDPSDGLLDLCIADRMNQLEMLSYVPSFLRGSHVNRKKITMAHARHARVTIDEGIKVLHADGEIIYTKEKQLEFELLPKRLRIVV